MASVEGVAFSKRWDVHHEHLHVNVACQCVALHIQSLQELCTLGVVSTATIPPPSYC